MESESKAAEVAPAQPVVDEGGMAPDLAVSLACFGFQRLRNGQGPQARDIQEYENHMN